MLTTRNRHRWCESKSDCSLVEGQISCIKYDRNTRQVESSSQQQLRRIILFYLRFRLLKFRLKISHHKKLSAQLKACPALSLTLFCRGFVDHRVAWSRFHLFTAAPPGCFSARLGRLGRCPQLRENLVHGAPDLAWGGSAFLSFPRIALGVYQVAG